VARDPIATVEVTPDDRKRYRLIQQHGACRTQPSERHRIRQAAVAS
jgi:hypothetical protein